MINDMFSERYASANRSGLYLPQTIDCGIPERVWIIDHTDCTVECELKETLAIRKAEILYPGPLDPRRCCKGDTWPGLYCVVQVNGEYKYHDGDAMSSDEWQHDNQCFSLDRRPIVYCKPIEGVSGQYFIQITSNIVGRTSWKDY